VDPASAALAASSVSEEDFDRKLVARFGTYGFLQAAWHLLCPGQEYSDNWHTYQVCAHLDAVAPARILVNGLVINVPPGTGKSVVTCVAWPVHTWIHDPSHGFMYLCFSDALSHKFAREAKLLIQSQWFQKRWPHVRVVGNKVGDYSTEKGGFRLSTSCQSFITGRHADTRVIDDPLKPVDADTAVGTGENRVMIDKINKSIWEGTVSTRVRKPTEPAFVLIMQRLHEEDLAGYILNTRKNVTHLRFPMRYESEKPCLTGLTLPNGQPGGDIRTDEGQLLWPSRYPEPAVKTLEIGLNQYASAQLQQDPTNADGHLIKKTWIKYWTELPKDLIEWGISWDMTFKDTAGSDFVCGQVWARTFAQFYLVDRICERMNFPSTLTAVRALHSAYKQAGTILVEDKANGPAVLATLSGQIPGMLAVEPRGGKVARLNAVSPFHRAGCVFYPHPDLPGKEWVKEHVADITGFPFRKHDDTVDAESQMLSHWLEGNNALLDALLAKAAAGDIK
jgi:predicted phage terminase large subunit-like protein